MLCLDSVSDDTFDYMTVTIEVFDNVEYHTSNAPNIDLVLYVGYRTHRPDLGRSIISVWYYYAIGRNLSSSRLA